MDVIEKQKKCERHFPCPNCGAGEGDVEWGEHEGYASGYSVLPGICRKCGCEFEEIYEYSYTRYIGLQEETSKSNKEAIIVRVSDGSNPHVLKTESEVNITFKIDRKEVEEIILDIKVHFIKESGPFPRNVITKVFVGRCDPIVFKDLKFSQSARIKTIKKLVEQEIEKMLLDKSKKVIRQLAKNIIDELKKRLTKEEIFYV